MHHRATKDVLPPALAEIDLAASIGELDLAGRVIDKHHMEFQTLNSEIAKGIMNILPVELQRKIKFLRRLNNKCPMPTGRQFVYQIFSFFNIHKNQVHTMNLNDLLHVELYNDNLKMFNQAREEHIISPRQDLDEGVLESFFEKQLGKSTLMKNALTLYLSDVVLKREPRSFQKLRTMVNDILRPAAAGHVDFSKKSDQETEQQQHTLLKELKKKAKFVDLGRQEDRARKAEHGLSNVTQQRKGKAQKLDQEAPLTETIPQKDRTTGENPSGKEDRLPCNDRECDHGK